MVVRYTGACLGLARSYRPRLVLVSAFPRILAPRGLSQICKYETPHKCNAWGAKSGKMHNHAQSIHVNPYKSFTNFPLVFLVFLQFNYKLEI
jgi:hypothetical protein